MRFQCLGNDVALKKRKVKEKGHRNKWRGKREEKFGNSSLAEEPYWAVGKLG